MQMHIYACVHVFLYLAMYTATLHDSDEAYLKTLQKMLRYSLIIWRRITRRYHSIEMFTEIRTKSIARELIPLVRISTHCICADDGIYAETVYCADTVYEYVPDVQVCTPLVRTTVYLWLIVYARLTVHVRITVFLRLIVYMRINVYVVCADNCIFAAKYTCGQLHMCR